MSLLRLPFFIAIISLLLLGGYSADAFGICHSHQESAQHQDAGSNPEASCDCACHLGYSDFLPLMVKIEAATSVRQAFTPHASEFPPEAIPLGIDHPPQLA